jgi:bile acid:Na+ symporter, BASS family
MSTFSILLLLLLLGFSTAYTGFSTRYGGLKIISSRPISEASINHRGDISSSSSLHSTSSSNLYWKDQLKALRRNKRQRALRWLDAATNVFPIWTILASVIGIIRPETFLWFAPHITPALALTMLAMGMTLTVGDFKSVMKTPSTILLGFIAQFSIMPFTAYLIAKLFKLGPELSAGLILVGCAPGGTASNIVTMIAKADVPLSVLMTMCSTVAAIFLTPFLTTKLVGNLVTINAMDLVASTVNVVFLPVILGVGINTAIPSVTRKVSRVTPPIGVTLIAFICGCIQALNRANYTIMMPFRLIGAVSALHSIGFGLGYLLAKSRGIDEAKARTISIETGMQNSALAVVLAKHFPNPLLSGLPGAVSATIHSTIGSILAACWRSRYTPSAPRSDTAEGIAISPTPNSSSKTPLPDQLRGSDEGVA